ALAERLALAGEAALFECMDAADVEAFITTPWVMTGTDGVLNHPIHPRTYGAFAKYIEVYVNEKKALTFAEAVRKITSLPADTFGLKDRGRLAKGYAADLVVMDLPRVKSPADYTNPEIYPQGIEAVMIDGGWV
ncbi:MAG: amidohydrolase family protein, partial [Defluviitaleaceae bacterium]|nr:amidohydrolase family protein [Defluviitaleaceae bacterium]